MEAAHRTRLAKGEVGIEERKPAPRLKEFAQRFIDAVQVRWAEKPATIRFYSEKLSRLLESAPMADSPLNRIDEGLIESYVEMRSKSGLAPATINRQLATLRRALRLAYKWHVIDRVPRVHLLAGEQSREFVLTHQQEQTFLAACPHPLRDIATVIVDEGLRTSEALQLEWRNVHLEPAPGAKFTYIRIPGGKSRNAKRNVPMTDRVAQLLLSRSLSSNSVYAFPSETGRPYQVTSIDHMHEKVRTSLRMPAEFVVYSLRHTYGTRLGEAGADAFAIMKLMGHSSVTVSQRYVHPTPETLERAVERLQAMNAQASRGLFAGQKGPASTTISTTVGLVKPLSS